MNFFDGNGTSIRSGNEINTLKKQLKALQEQTDALSVAISDLEDTVTENKGESEQRDLALGENISINTNDINSLEENLENYKTSQAVVTEAQVIRTSEYVETPLVRTEKIVCGENDLEEVITDFETQVNNQITDTQNKVEELNSAVELNEQKLDTVLSRGNIPVSTDEVELENALITNNGSVLKIKEPYAISDSWKPDIGSLIQYDGDNYFILKTDNLGYTIGYGFAFDVDKTLEEVFEWIDDEVNNKIFFATLDIPIILGSVDNQSDSIKILNSGLLNSAFKFKEEDLESYTFDDDITTLFIVTDTHKIYKYENHELTDVTETKTQFDAHDNIIGYGLQCYYRNNYKFRYESNVWILHHTTVENGVTKYTYWSV